MGTGQSGEILSNSAKTISASTASAPFAVSCSNYLYRYASKNNKRLLIL